VIPQPHYILQSDLTTMSTTRNSLSLCTPIGPSSELTTMSPIQAADIEQGFAEPVSSSVATSTTNASSNLCFSREIFTCLALTSIVIGLPVLIIIVLINLPRLSNRRDTRQDSYLLLAFGIPFSLVV